MPITFACACGKTLKVADEHAGKRVKCPACQGVAAVPAAAADFEVVEDEPPKARPVVARAMPVAAVPAKPAKRSDDDFDIVEDDEDDRPRKKRSNRRDEDDEDDRPRSKRSSRRDDDDEDDDRPRKKKVAAYADDDDEDDRPRKKRKKKSKRKPEGASAGKRMLSLVGGLVAVLVGGAIAYFVWTSEASGRGVGKAIVIGIAIMVGGIGAIFNGITGNFGDGEGEERFDDDADDDDRGGGDWDDD